MPGDRASDWLPEAATGLLVLRRPSAWPSVGRTLPRPRQGTTAEFVNARLLHGARPAGTARFVNSFTSLVTLEPPTSTPEGFRRGSTHRPGCRGTVSRRHRAARTRLRGAHRRWREPLRAAGSTGS